MGRILRLLILLAFLFIAATYFFCLRADTVYIKRNQAWNEVVANINPFLDDLDTLYVYLKKHEAEPKITEYDVNALKKLDDAIARAEAMKKHLQTLREEVKEGR